MNRFCKPRLNHGNRLRGGISHGPTYSCGCPRVWPCGHDRVYLKTVTEPTGSAKQAFPRSGLGAWGSRVWYQNPGESVSAWKNWQKLLHVAHAVPMLILWDLVARPVGAMVLIAEISLSPTKWSALCQTQIIKVASTYYHVCWCWWYVNRITIKRCVPDILHLWFPGLCNAIAN